jgi:hypothetical protein
MTKTGKNKVFSVNGQAPVDFSSATFDTSFVYLNVSLE